MARRPKKRAVSSEPFETAVTALGAQGDGLAENEATDGTRLFIPYTVPGDRVRARRTAVDRAEPLDWLTLGPRRQTPPCPHFGPGKCGGCAVQHLDDAFYAEWKARIAADTLARAGLAGFELAPLRRTAPRERRRAEFVARVSRGEVTVGFHARGSHDIVAIGPCPILVPALERVLGPLREFLSAALAEPSVLDILATALDSGLELVFTGAAPPDRARREACARFAEQHDLTRIAWRRAKTDSPETIIQRRPLRIQFGDIPVDLPAAAFLQASAAGERAIVEVVRTATGTARRLADLYAGSGAIALALADGKRRIHAVEAAKEMIEALDLAARRAGFGGPISVERRDLVRRPLIGEELAAFDAVVFDPPREGAAAQAVALADSKVPVVIGVSCNPATFARDAQILVRGGYRLTAVTPIDQFLWSPHLELVGEFRRGRQR